MHSHPANVSGQTNHPNRDARYTRCQPQSATQESRDVAHSPTHRSRSALEMTKTEGRLIAAAAIIGDRSVPVNGYSTPAATCTPTTLQVKGEEQVLADIAVGGRGKFARQDDANQAAA